MKCVPSEDLDQLGSPTSLIRVFDVIDYTFKYSKTCVKGPLSKRPKIGFQDQLLLNAGQKYCRMLQWEHSAIFSTYIKLPFVIKIFILSVFVRLFTLWFYCTVLHMVNVLCFFLFSNKILDIRHGIHKMLGRIANREGPDQTTSDLRCSLICVCTDCLGHLNRQLQQLFKILKHLP